MARHKDYKWDLPEGRPISTGGNNHSWESIHAALLMDLRDELKRLNSLLHCVNFMEMPGYLRQIATNTTKKKRTKGSA